MDCYKTTKQTQTALFSKKVYWHIRVANVISYNTVAGITHDIGKSCKGGLIVYKDNVAPLIDCFFSLPSEPQQQQTKKKTNLVTPASGVTFVTDHIQIYREAW